MQRFLSIGASLALVAACVARSTPTGAQQPPASPVEAFVHALPSLARDASTVDELATRVQARARGIGEVAVSMLGGSSPALHVAFAPPLDAARTAALLGVARPYATSGDVHQTRWHVVEWAGTVPDRYNARIATRTPAAGRWSLRIELVTRPAGALPPEVSGASPAYDLQHYAASIRAIDFEMLQ